MECFVAEGARLLPGGGSGTKFIVLNRVQHVRRGKRVEPIELNMKTSCALEQVYQPPKPPPGLGV